MINWNINPILMDYFINFSLKPIQLWCELFGITYFKSAIQKVLARINLLIRGILLEICWYEL